MPEPTPDPGPDGKARRFGRAVILLGAVAAVILIALFISPKSEPRPARAATDAGAAR